MLRIEALIQLAWWKVDNLDVDITLECLWALNIL